MRRSGDFEGKTLALKTKLRFETETRIARAEGEDSVEQRAREAPGESGGLDGDRLEAGVLHGGCGHGIHFDD